MLAFSAGKDSGMLARSLWFSVAVGSLCLGCWGLAVPALAQEFRVETEVFVEDGKEPIAESLTLFTADVVYDLLLLPSVETTIFDTKRGKLVLLDNERQVKATLTTEQLMEFTAAIKARGIQQVTAALFQPRFETTYDEEQLRLTLASDSLTYKAKGLVPKHEEDAQRYRQFADWYARLNAIRPGNLPPFGRLELNQALAERNLLPLEVERTVVFDRPLGNRKLFAKSKHAVNWIISGTDRGRIETAGQNLVKFREVSPQEYWAEPTKTARTK